jgi:hypothetical protein
MKMIVEAQALVTYICELTDEDSKKVLEYMEEYNVDEDEALNKLWFDCEDGIDVYAGSQVESDCNTEKIIFLRKEKGC